MGNIDEVGRGVEPGTDIGGSSDGVVGDCGASESSMSVLYTSQNFQGDGR